MKLGNNFTGVLSNYLNFDKTQVKLFPNFTSIPFDYLLISWVTNYARNRGVLTCSSYRERQALKNNEIMKKSCRRFLPHFRVFLLELTNAKQIVPQRLPVFYPANSLNRAPSSSIEQGFTNAFKTRTTKLLTNVNFGSKFVFKN